MSILNIKTRNARSEQSRKDFVHEKMRNELTLIERARSTWDELELPGTSCNDLERDGTSNEPTQKERNSWKDTACAISFANKI